MIYFATQLFYITQEPSSCIYIYISPKAASNGSCAVPLSDDPSPWGPVVVHPRTACTHPASSTLEWMCRPSLLSTTEAHPRWVSRMRACTELKVSYRRRVGFHAAPSPRELPTRGGQARLRRAFFAPALAQYSTQMPRTLTACGRKTKKVRSSPWRRCEIAQRVTCGASRWQPLQQPSQPPRDG